MAFSLPRSSFAVLAFAAAVVLVAAFGGVQAKWYLPVDALLLAAAALSLLVAASFKPPALFLAMVVLLSIPLLQLGLHATVDRAATEAGFVQLLAPAAAFILVMAAANDPRAGRWLLHGLAALAGVLAFLAFIQYWISPQDIYGVVHITGAWPVGPFVNHNDFVAALELTFPAALFLALRPSLPWSLVAALALAAAVMGASRGGAIGIAVEILLVVWVARPSPKLLAVAGILVIFAAATGLGPLLKHFRESEPSARARFSLDLSSWQMGLDRPLLGQGLGAWPDVYPRFARFDEGDVYTAAHDEYAQWWAETGIIGSLAALALIAAWLLPALKNLKHSDLNAAGAIAVAGFAAHSTVDFLGHIPALALLFAMAAAMAVWPERKRGGSQLSVLSSQFSVFSA